MLVNDRLVQIREATGMTRKEVAEKIGIDQSTYGKYELGKLQPSVTVLDRIAYLYSTSTDYLLGLTDNPDKNIVARPGDFWIVDGKKIHYEDMPEKAQQEFNAFLRYLKHEYDL